MSYKIDTRPKDKRGPLWATPQALLELIPEMAQAMRAEQYPGNWLAGQYRAEKVKRRERNPMKEYIGRGRPPQFEYNVASVRRRVKELLSR